MVWDVGRLNIVVTRNLSLLSNLFGWFFFLSFLFSSSLSDLLACWFCLFVPLLFVLPLCASDPVLRCICVFYPPFLLSRCTFVLHNLLLSLLCWSVRSSRCIPSRARWSWQIGMILWIRCWWWVSFAAFPCVGLICSWWCDMWFKPGGATIYEQAMRLPQCQHVRRVLSIRYVATQDVRGEDEKCVMLCD